MCSSFAGWGAGSGSGAFSSVSSIEVTLPVLGRDLVPPRSRADFGLCLEIHTDVLIPV